ncbi:hypothetical protein BUALT_Bualt02G0079000 [Buddleja alternifolia]|uniref:RING-type E3 ubiquitin transferase n=1 Tax=Buddleja alternifolia TaxID=168488 RepID=A0AAV6Y2K5_9LAMI|nr:hypothetical protein BUALT_Bualt02G0079000 [Buddleja alternifolia]
MPVVVAADSSVGRSSRKARNAGQSDREIDPNSSRLKPTTTTTISSILFSSSSSSPTTNDTAAAANDRIKKKTKKKNNFTSATFGGLGCTASSQVSVPAAIRSSATWETKKLKKKRLLLLLNNNNNNNNKTKKNNNDTASSAVSNPSSSSLSLALSSSCVGVPDVWCAPGIGAAIDVAAAAASASVDSVVSRRPPPARGKLDGVDHHIILPHSDQRPYTVRRMVTSEDIPFLESDTALGMHRLRSDVYGSRHRHVRHGFREGLAEIVMLQRGRSDGIDRYRDLRLDVDNMSYEELVELGERIGYVSTGLREDEIACCLRTTKLAMWDDFSSHFVSEKERKCSICQEEYEADDEMGKLKCGHFYHIDCIKQWLGHKNICPICKTAAALPLKPNLSSS